MSDLSSAIVHLTMRFNEQTLSTGSGVFYKRAGQYYVVTAWHNVSGRHTDSMECLDQKNNAVPNNILVSFKYHIFGQVTVRNIRLPLYDDTKALYHIHPDNLPRVDVVAIPFDVNGLHTSVGYSGYEKMEFEYSLFDEEDNLTIHAIQQYLVDDVLAKRWMNSANVTDEVFIPGYPHNITDQFYNPVWKRATIATNPAFQWQNARKFLIDSASSSGMSGASVFYYNNAGDVNILGHHINVGRIAAIHAGIYVGRVGVTEKADPQVGIVWHASVIDEIIDGKVFDFHPDEIEMARKDIEAVIREHLKTANAKGIENILNENTPSRHYVHSQIMKDIKGRAKPGELMQLILDVTAAYDGPLVEDKG
ncbi:MULTISPECIES: hypothetical protein [Klebsiella]|nr:MULTISPECIES: hypothetical protein [Klebsiella]